MLRHDRAMARSWWGRDQSGLTSMARRKASHACSKLPFSNRMAPIPWCATAFSGSSKRACLKVVAAPSRLPAKKSMVPSSTWFCTFSGSRVRPLRWAAMASLSWPCFSRAQASAKWASA
ncbi:hypothetical protein D3C87_1439350 [compost metagenome]